MLIFRNTMARAALVASAVCVFVFLTIYGTNCGSSNHGGIASPASSNSSPAGGSDAVNTGPLITMIALGDRHACAAIGDRVQCWGRNAFGQLGNGASTNLPGAPVWVSGLRGTITGLIAAASHTCAIVDGAVLCWGRNDWLGLNSTTPVAMFDWGSSSGVVALASGFYNLCAVRQGGVQCAGQNTYGQLGNGSNTNSGTPLWVTGLGAGSSVRKLSMSSFTTCAETPTNLLCWGENSNGNLGQGDYTNRSTPTPVSTLAVPLSSWAVGTSGTCATNASGTYCWGTNQEHQLGTISGGLLPDLSAGLNGPGALLKGVHNTCRLSAGVLSCVGRHRFMFADGDTASIDIDTLTPLTALGTDVTAADLNHGTAAFACAVKDSRSIVCWGEENTFGQLGVAASAYSAVPVTVLLAQPI